MVGTAARPARRLRTHRSTRPGTCEPLGANDDHPPARHKAAITVGRSLWPLSEEAGASPDDGDWGAKRTAGRTCLAADGDWMAEDRNETKLLLNHDTTWYAW